MRAAITRHLARDPHKAAFAYLRVRLPFSTASRALNNASQPLAYRATIRLRDAPFSNCRRRMYRMTRGTRTSFPLARAYRVPLALLQRPSPWRTI